MEFWLTILANYFRRVDTNRKDRSIGAIDLKNPAANYLIDRSPEMRPV